MTTDVPEVATPKSAPISVQTRGVDTGAVQARMNERKRLKEQVNRQSSMLTERTDVSSTGKTLLGQ